MVYLKYSLDPTNSLKDVHFIHHYGTLIAICSVEESVCMFSSRYCCCCCCILSFLYLRDEMLKAGQITKLNGKSYEIKHPEQELV